LIYRKILKVKTVGSRETKDLRPDIELPRGLNSLVLEYLPENMCIVEIWGSDHPILNTEERYTPEKLNKVVEQALETLDSHPMSPKTLGAITMLKSTIISLGSEIDEETKTIKVRGKTYKFKRKEFDDRYGEDRYILDEG